MSSDQIEFVNKNQLTSNNFKSILKLINLNPPGTPKPTSFLDGWMFGKYNQDSVQHPSETSIYFNGWPIRFQVNVIQDGIIFGDSRSDHCVNVTKSELFFSEDFHLIENN